MQPQIILLKEGTENSQGKPQLISNINACQAVVETVRTTLGPRGMDKLIVDQGGKSTISNDGATIMKLLEIVHPAAKTLVDIAKSQDAEVGDGTTSVVLLAGEFLKQVKPFIEEGVHPRIIIKAIRKALQLCLEKISALAVKIEKSNTNEHRALLEKCAATALSSKLIHQQKDFFSKIVVDAVLSLDDLLPLNMIGIKKVQGGALEDSKLVDGVAFKKTFSYAGFEMQPKKYNNPKIAMLNIELELKAERDNAEIRVDNVQEYQKVVDAEWQILYEKLDKLVKSGVQVVLSKLPIGDVATQYFADRDMFCAGRVPEEDLKRTMKACGGAVMTTVQDLNDSVLGTCQLFEENQIGGERFNFFSGCPNAKTCTLVLRGGAEQFLEETERSLHDAIMIVRRTIKNDAIVAGGGAIEMELSKMLRDYSKTIAGKEQLLIGAVAKALEIIPRQLCDNAGFDATNILNKLRQKHAQVFWSVQPKENLRMKYRYLDLRFSDMQYRLRLRSQVLMRMREFLINQRGFVEVETPTLFRRTPGGAQEYVVPTRTEDRFYSLVQSPQQLKQLLMVGAMDRYFQVARCYRDEGARPDRQPEFTQMDIELSFTDKDSIMSLIEDLLKASWPGNLKPLHTPFQVISYHEAMQLYGTDKPDLSIDNKLVDISELVTEEAKESLPKELTGVKNFTAKVLVCGPQDLKKMEDSFAECEELQKKKSTNKAKLIIAKCAVNRWKKVLTDSLPFLDAEKLRDHLDLSFPCSIVVGLGKDTDVLPLLGKLRQDVFANKSSSFHFAWIVDFPLFVEEEDGSLVSAHHPFTQARLEDAHLLLSAPNQVRGQHFDLVLNGFEVGGGSVRIHDPDLQTQVLKDILKIPVDSLSHLLEALRSGAPPHGGIALGVDRLLSIMAGAETIRDVIAFPKGVDGKDPLSGAPCNISDAEKRMYHLLPSTQNK